MTAEIIQFVPKGNPRRETTFTSEYVTIGADELPAAIMAILGEPIPYAGQGIDGMWTDTSPSEYVAPLDDPA